MSRKMVVVTTCSTEALSSCTSMTPSETPATPSDWTKCIICQVEIEDKFVRCPAKSNRSCTSGYETFVSNLLEFQKLGQIPLDVDPRRLDDGEGI